MIGKNDKRFCRSRRTRVTDQFGIETNERVEIGIEAYHTIQYIALEQIYAIEPQRNEPLFIPSF
jgi:hypothetical protein